MNDENIKEISCDKFLELLGISQENYGDYCIICHLNKKKGKDRK